MTPRITKLFQNQYCDMGTLRENLHAGLFHQPLEPADGNPTSGPSGGPGGGGPGPIAVDMAALLRVALEIAEAVSYMHSIRLCHCDIKVRFSGWAFGRGALHKKLKA